MQPFSLLVSASASHPGDPGSTRDPLHIHAYMHNEVIKRLSEVLNCYEKASSAKVNWNKSEALWVGQGQLECLPQLPWDLRWGREGIKLLGIFFVLFFFGSDNFQILNWRVQ